jgi:hypothetical protein
MAKKSKKYFFNITYDVFYHLIKFDIKTQRIHEETNITNLIKG